MEEIEKVSEKVSKDKFEVLKIVELYSKDSVSFHEFIQDINDNYSKGTKNIFVRFYVENCIC